jgi:hypothetical protein
MRSTRCPNLQNIDSARTRVFNLHASRRTADVRQHFLNLATAWRTAAQQIDDGIDDPPITKLESKAIERNASCSWSDKLTTEEVAMRAAYVALGMSDKTIEAALQARREHPFGPPRAPHSRKGQKGKWPAK